MPELGKLALAIALILAVYSIAANIYGVRRGAPDFIVSARHALWAMCAMVTIAVVALWTALLRSDFSLEYVASYSSTTLPTVYKITSLWGGQQGSLLFWTWLLSIFTSIAAFQNRRRNPEIAPYALAVLAGVAIFFLGDAELRHPAVRLPRRDPCRGRRPESAAAELLDGDPSAVALHRLRERDRAVRVRRRGADHRQTRRRLDPQRPAAGRSFPGSF